MFSFQRISIVLISVTICTYLANIVFWCDLTLKFYYTGMCTCLSVAAASAKFSVQRVQCWLLSLQNALQMHISDHLPSANVQGWLNAKNNISPENYLLNNFASLG